MRSGISLRTRRVNSMSVRVQKINGARIKTGTSTVWRSMIGFDLIQSIQSFPGMAWTRGLPGGIGYRPSHLLHLPGD